jgi:putative FmdB family regulatory protein
MTLATRIFFWYISDAEVIFNAKTGDYTKMPTYEYECSSFGKNFEFFQSIKDEPIAECPECKGALKRLIGGGMGVIFKGSGFYSTDHKRSSASISTSDSDKDTAAKNTPATTEAKPAKDEKKSA